jgi:hypothetical protein
LGIWQSSFNIVIKKITFQVQKKKEF